MEIGEKASLEIATGGQPADAVAAAVLPYSAAGHVLDVGVAHDDDCPCTTRGEQMPSCTCEIVELHLTRVA